MGRGIGQYDVETTKKPGGCCRHYFWGWKEMKRYDMGTSALGWSRFSRVWALVFIRVIFALWALATIIWGMIQLNGRYASNGIAPSPWWSWGIYLSHWSLFSTMLYFMSFSYFTIREIRTGGHGPMNWGEKWLWINYEIAWCTTWACALGFWLMQRSGWNCTFAQDCSEVTWYEIHVYGISVGWLLFELLFNLMRWKWLHGMFPLIFLCFWFVAAAIWHGQTGVWVYPEQDDTIVGGGGAFGFYAVLFLLVAGFHLCGWGCSLLLEKCYKKGRRVTDNDLHGSDPVQINEMCCG